MQVEAKIPLGDVHGRIDHLAVDVARRRLFVAELGNDSLSVVDLAAGAAAHRIRGLREPQGVAFVPAADVLLVANAGDGTVERYRGTDLVPLGRTLLGADADNLRPNPAGGGLVWVGHGGAGHGAAGARGGLTALDAATGQQVGPTIPLPAHPESFQLEATGPRAFANLPGAGDAVAVLDRATRRQVATWSVPGFRANFPMALDERGGRLFVGFRGPPTLAVLDLGNGAVLARLPLCGDADDLFLDARRHRLYAICGEGVVETFEDPGGARAEAARIPRHLTRLPTAVGARTGLFVPELDRLFVAVRAAPGEPAAVWVLRPGPP
ncbi:YncE family protein [Siccirubricoccus sp. G192]|uniref:YncE family protein n=1 Tax=Siccirubricoccus sp. G192 TaxID=2849651 RepID=UPI001C2BAAB4|nr:hypothetical protein [Siccirubricoccus sp. G192]MBV1799203.1 hypothetical protein [Siccirubricoccus sp. G192]